MDCKNMLDFFHIWCLKQSLTTFSTQFCEHIGQWFFVFNLTGHDQSWLLGNMTSHKNMTMVMVMTISNPAKTVLLEESHWRQEFAGKRRKKEIIDQCHKWRLEFTGVNKILGSKVRCLFCFDTSTTEGRGGEKGGCANSRTKHTEPLTSELISPLYIREKIF